MRAGGEKGVNFLQAKFSGYTVLFTATGYQDNNSSPTKESDKATFASMVDLSL